MSDSKFHQFRPPLYHESSQNGNSNDQSGKGLRHEQQGRDQQGWEAYRKWLSSMNGNPRSRRAPIDHSVYSWKGYQSWADRVRQSWEPEEN
jgi:hypothetical protein